MDIVWEAEELGSTGNQSRDKPTCSSPERACWDWLCGWLVSAGQSPDAQENEKGKRELLEWKSIYLAWYASLITDHINVET